MLIALLVFSVLQTLFVMACVGHLASIEKIVVKLAEAKIQEMKIWSGGNAKP